MTVRFRGCDFKTLHARTRGARISKRKYHYWGSVAHNYCGHGDVTLY